MFRGETSIGFHSCVRVDMTVIETMSASNELGSSGLSPVMVKTSQEILTSLHLIKDIRRLEKYQRDFFLKVITN